MLFTNHVNSYRFVGDACHVVATWIILLKLINTRSASGISGKTQLLFALTYTFRYLDLYTRYISDYNSVMKAYYIIYSWVICYLIWSSFSGKTYQREKDSFRIEFLMIIVTLLAFTVNYESTLIEIAWTWSIYMESVALLPQLYMIWTTKKTDAYVLLYVLAMALYRAFYIGNWIYRYSVEEYYDPIAVGGGCVEVFVGLIGFLTIITVCLGKSSNQSLSTKTQHSIYTLPSVVEQFGKDYKILRNTASVVPDERINVNNGKPSSFENLLEGSNSNSTPSAPAPAPTATV